MDAENPNWELAAFFGRVNQYYFTGTMQDGLLLVPAPVSRCSGCAEVSSGPGRIALSRHPPMKSFRDAAPAAAAAARQVIHLETELVPSRWSSGPKTFSRQGSGVTGRTGRPGAGGQEPLRTGHHGTVWRNPPTYHGRQRADDVARGNERSGVRVRTLFAHGARGSSGNRALWHVQRGHVVAQLGFGENSIYPTSSTGGRVCGHWSRRAGAGEPRPKTSKGRPSVRGHRLWRDGYSTDKTMTYMFGRPLADEVIAVHGVAWNSSAGWHRAETRSDTGGDLFPDHEKS